jgi:diaminopropionate ammonia-lyase
MSIESEGAAVLRVQGSYDAAVRAAANFAETPGRALVQDTAFDGYEKVPRWVVEGYETILLELDDQFRARGKAAPDLIVVPVGVGSLLQAVIAHYRRPAAEGDTSVVGVEPVSAAFLPRSLAAGEAIAVDTSSTIMAGLNCGTASSLAWPVIRTGIDGAVTVTDSEAAKAGRDLAKLGVPAGPCGAASLAGLRRILSGPQAHSRAQHVGIGAHGTVVLLVTEGSEANPLPPNQP